MEINTLFPTYFTDSYAILKSKNLEFFEVEKRPRSTIFRIFRLEDNEDVKRKTAKYGNLPSLEMFL